MNEKLNLQNLIDLLADRHNMSKKDAENFVKEFFVLIEESLENDKYVKIRGLGTFKLIDVENRESVNINTGERFEIQGHTKVSFTPDSSLKDAVNKPFAHFETVILNDDTVLDDTAIENMEEEDTEVSSEMTEASENEPEITIEEPINEEDNKQSAVEMEEIPSIAKENTTETAELPVESIEVIEATRPITEPTESSAPAPMPTGDTDTSTMKYFIGIVIFVIVLCGGAVSFMYFPDMFDSFLSTPPTEETVDENVEKSTDKVALTDSVLKKDTASAVKPDTTSRVASVKPTIEQKTPDNTANTDRFKKEEGKAVTPVASNDGTFKIIGTKENYIVKKGETLRKISFIFYGTKNLWSYIVEHNPTTIKNPDNVPYDTVIKIPELVKK